MQLSDELTVLKGVGTQTKQTLEKLGLKTIKDLLYYFPRAYKDYSVVSSISEIHPGNVTIKAKISSVSSRYSRRGLHITEATAQDKTGSVKLVWFNQTYRANSLKKDESYYISGLFGFASNRLSITNPALETSDSLPLHGGRIVAIYPETKGLTSRQLRVFVSQILSNLSHIEETLPKAMVTTYGFYSLRQALVAKHLPRSMEEVNKANVRLGFEELFELILASLYIKKDIHDYKAHVISFDESVAKQFVANLPFELTVAQKKAAMRLLKDIDSSQPMNRLLEGDVGSGKTIVALMIAFMAMKQGYNVVLLAPTELLARQHAATAQRTLSALALDKRVTLLTGSLSALSKKQIKDLAKTDSQVKLYIGTHALLQHDVDIQNVGLVIVDEQHRFGVQQRKHLLATGDKLPHMLSMTATPIPRSLALTVFGEMDVSVLNEKPASRQVVQTSFIAKSMRQELYANLKQALQRGEQIYVVCPTIDSTLTPGVLSAEQTYKEVKKHLPKTNVALLHGKQSAHVKNQTMEDFQKGAIDVLVSTTVIEVGVDVPNASVMVIESAERFGLAQLHQLRGRIGRGDKPGHCYIVSDKLNPRLQAICNVNDGFKLAEFDLELRGAGALYGVAQHGQLDLKIASFIDTPLIAKARESAVEFMKDPRNLVQYPHIKEKITRLQSVVHLN